MTRRRWPTAPIALLIGGVVVLVLGPSLHTATPLRLWAAVVGAVGLIATERSISAAPLLRHRKPPFAPPSTGRVETQLHELHRAIGEATASNWGVYTRLRPLLREIVEERLAFRRVDFDADPLANALVDPELWEVVRPDSPRPERRDEPGLTTVELDALLDEVDRL